MKDSKNILFIVFGFSFLWGVFIYNLLENPILGIIVLSFLIILFLNFFVFVKLYFIRFIFAIIWLSVGLFTASISATAINTDLEILDTYYWHKSKLTLEIIDIHKLSEFRWEYKVRLISINEVVVNKKLNWLIAIPSNFTIDKWDIVVAREKLLKIENFSSDFNYQKFMYSKKLFFRIKANSIHSIWKVEQNKVLEKIDTVRTVLLKSIYKLYPKEEAIFLWWILLWARESLPQELKDDFNASWLTHFIAVSGFNITILIVFISYVLKIFPVVVRTIAITIFIVLFTLLVWEAAPVIRASIMGLLAYYIMVSGRNTHNLALLLFTACLMVLFFPLILNYDVSFHLSFLAVIWIIYTQKFWKKMFYFLPETLAIKEAFVLTLSALVFALPVMLFNFGQLSIMAPFANIAVTWTIPLAMLGGFLSILVDFVSPYLGQIFAYVTWVLLAWDIKVVHFFGGLDWAVFKYNFWIWKYSLEFLYFLIIIFIINYFQSVDD